MNMEVMKERIRETENVFVGFEKTKRIFTYKLLSQQLKQAGAIHDLGSLFLPNEVGNLKFFFMSRRGTCLFVQ